MVTEDTGIGNPKASSKEKGERFFTDVTQKVAEFMIDLEKLDLADRYE
jgi:creatinine amidohydrolase